MVDKNIKVSVLMTAYNREKYISEAIESVLNQTYSLFELIIVDDGSIDNTMLIAHKYKNLDSRISLYQNNVNLGDYPNRNQAASYAKGDLIMFVDSDDSILPDALEYIVNCFNSNSTASHSAIYYGNDITEPLLLNSVEAIRNHYFSNNSLAGGPGSRVFLRSFFNEMNGYSTRYGPANDLYFNIISVISSPILFLPYDYLNYRIHDHQEKNNYFAYLYHGYNYLNELLFNSSFPLGIHEKQKLYIGNKRRFLVNLFKYTLLNKSLKNALIAVRLANFTFKDFCYCFTFSSRILSKKI